MHGNEKSTFIVGTGDTFYCTLCNFNTPKLSALRDHYDSSLSTRHVRCSPCDAQFNCACDLNRHRNTSHPLGENPIECNRCLYKCASLKEFTRHTFRRHDGGKVHRCNACASREPPTPSDSRSHGGGGVPFQCLNCSFETLHTELFKHHLYSHIVKKPFTCIKCSFSCGTSEGLKLHIAAHKGEKLSAFSTALKTFRCNVCDFECNALRNLRKHMYVHTGEKPLIDAMNKRYLSFKCEVKWLCPTEKAKPKRIRKKWKEDTVVRTYTCEICSMTARLTKTELNAHYKTHGKALGLKKYRRGPPKPNQMFACEICSAKFASEEDLDEHIANHDDQHKCDVCKRGFKKIIDYTMHMQTHNDDKLYKCPLCDFNTSNAYQIKPHVFSHSFVKRYECPIEGCKKGFMLSTHFEEHKNYHTGERPFVCETCGSAFMYSRYLSAHRVATHSTKRITCEVCSEVCVGQKNFRSHLLSHKRPEWVCATCGKTFRKRVGLTTHELMHAGYKPHKCRYCDKVFGQRGYLNQHVRTHTGDKPYDCDYCGKKFTQRSSLVRHVRGHTGEKPHTCHFCNNGYTTKATLASHLKNCKGPSE